MGARIRIDSSMFRALERHIDQAELAAFMLADFDGCDFAVVDMKPVALDGYSSRSGYHLELPDLARPQLIAWALANERCLIEIHSHGPGFPQFSGSDQLGFVDWVPHVRWRLQGRPYAALVRSGTEWDGLAWTGSAGEVQAVEAIEITSGESDVPLGDRDAATPTTRTIRTTVRSIKDV
jgi:hypothetical protein